MRRFIASMPGKLVRHLVVLALVLPYLSLALVTRAEAQLQTLPAAAVTEFKNLKSPGTKFGQQASDSVITELGKANTYMVQSPETVTRTLVQLGLSSPVEGTINLVRLGQALEVSTIVTGDVVDYTVRKLSGGRQGLVAMRVIVYDVASGLPVNGASVSGQSTIRGGDVQDETLIGEAIATASADAVRQITQRALPSGIIMNTDQDSALINKGTRDGFKDGQDVVIIRDRKQVGRGVVQTVQPDSAHIKITSYTLGIAPSDKVRVLYTPPVLKPGFSADGEAQAAASKSKAPNGAIITTLLLVGLLAYLLTGKNASSQDLATVKAEPTVDNTGRAAVLTSWAADNFAGGNTSRVKWQIWRNDVVATPVWTVTGTTTSWTDTVDTKPDFPWTDIKTVGGTTCDNTDYDGATASGVAGVTAGIPYTYQVNLVYRINQNDLPGQTGSTSGTDTTTTWCYFISDLSTAIGTATPIARPVLYSPSNGSYPSSTVKFFVNSPFTLSSSGVDAEYVLQFSPTISFSKSTVVNALTWHSNGTGTIGTPSNIDTTASTFPTWVTTGDFYWRIGARNANDNPGPVADSQTGDRFVFSTPFLFRRP